MTAAFALSALSALAVAPLAPFLLESLRLSRAHVGFFLPAVYLGGVLMALPAGWLTDLLGVRRTLGLGQLLTGAMVALAGLTGSLPLMLCCLVVAGFGFSVANPATGRAIVEWFPARERGMAMGIKQTGLTIGGILGSLLLPPIALRLGWQFAFLFTGAFSAVWIVCWLTLYRRPQDDPKLSPLELAHILSDPPETSAKIAWSSLLAHRQTWTFLLGKFLTDPIWWFFLFWLPKFFSTVHGVSLLGLRLPLIVIYNSATIGSIFGGWLAARLIQAGWTVNRARKTAMLVCAIAVVPVMLAPRIQSLWGAVALISVAVAAHQGWSANLFTLASDMFPRNAVASVVGIGSFGGAIGGALIATFTGFLLQATHSYVPIFLIAGSAYLVALLIIQSLCPGLQPLSETVKPIV